MARIIPSAFTTYELTEDEKRSGAILSETQKQVLRNVQCEKVHSRLSLKFDLLNPGAFLQEEAYLKGQIELIQYLLDQSMFEEEAIKEEAAARNN